MLLRFLTTWIVLALMAITLDARAQSATDLARAAQLKEQGDALVHSLHYREALSSYDAAFAISHDPAILYNRARALDALGETPEALDAFEAFVRVAPPELKAKVPKLQELVAATRERVATIVIRCPVAGATVFVRNRREGMTPLATPLRFSTGSALLEVQAAGYRPFRRTLTLTPGEPITIDVPLEAEPAAMPAVPAPAEAHGGNGWKWGAYSTGALGIVGIGLGATFGVLAIGRQIGADATCPGKVCEPAGSLLISEARTFATISTVSFIVGGVGLATSLLFFLWKPGSTRTEARLEPMLGPLFAGVRGSFE